jgi:hypothetical protein
MTMQPLIRNPASASIIDGARSFLVRQRHMVICGAVRASREWIVLCVWACACGDNVVPVGVPLAHSDVLFLGAHEDDDMIFMQPELLSRIAEGASTTTIYATTSGPEGRGPGILFSATVAYGKIAGSQAWDCGSIPLGTIAVEHCRLRDRPISLVDFGLQDGGIYGARPESLLHLIDGSVQQLSADTAGSVTSESVIELFADALEATTPDTIETLELAATHGRDNSSHMFVASIGLWAAARVGYSGPVTWHRGYNVEFEAPTLDGDALSIARTMLGYYEACSDHCAACGELCPSLLPSHEMWLARQYSAERVRAARGKLALDDRCLDGSLALGDCANALEVELEPTGALRVGELCVTSSAANEVMLAPCTAAPEQYWVLDSDGTLWNGRPPQRAADMTYDHVRCLAPQGAPTCGANLQVHWTLLPHEMK